MTKEKESMLDELRLVISEESAIIPMSRLNMYKGLERTLLDLLNGEKFFKVVTTFQHGYHGVGERHTNRTEIFASSEWEARAELEYQIRELKRKNEALMDELASVRVAIDTNKFTRKAKTGWWLF